MASEKERILDLLLEKTRTGHVQWGYREPPPPVGIASLTPFDPSYREQAYTAEIKTEAGELLVVLRVPGAVSRAFARPIHLTVRDTSCDVELVLTPEDVSAEKLRELSEMVTHFWGNAIIKALEEA